MNKLASSHVPDTTGTSRGGPQSVGRIFTILDTLARQESGATLSELATIVEAPKTSLVGLLAGMIQEGCLVRDDFGKYFLGPQFISLAMRTVSGKELSSLVLPILAKLVEETGETAAFGNVMPNSDMSQYLAKIESTNPVRYAIAVGEQRELYCTAMGKVLLAYYSDGDLKRYLKNTHWEQYTPGTITDPDKLKAELMMIRKEGIARTYDERFPGASGVGVPVLSKNSKLVGALSIAGPTERLQKNASLNEKSMKEAGLECSRLIGNLAEFVA